LGQLVTKNLALNSSGSYLQTLAYRYNIRGQLININNSQLTPDGGVSETDPNALFGETIMYDQPDSYLGTSGHASFSGRISAVKWMSKTTSNAKSNERSYIYAYDQLGRYTGSTYNERLSTSSNTTAFGVNTDGYDENGITYDENGNIITLLRTELVSGAVTNIDNLGYTYDSTNPDRLLKVGDATANNLGFNNFAGATASASYGYDNNGNINTDPYKGTSMSYNIMGKINNITSTVASLSGAYIDYTYAADGTLLRKRVYTSSTSTTPTITDYLDGFVYSNASGSTLLSYVPMPEGRAVNTGTGTTVTLTAEYVMTDHQGNARFSFQDNGSGGIKIIQENSYYGFGEVQQDNIVATTTLANNNLYNGGSEWQNVFDNLPDYDMTFYRNYDPALGRFTGVDPKPESAGSMTVYQYSNNNPIMFNDPLGDISQDEFNHAIDLFNNLDKDPSDYGGYVDGSDDQDYTTPAQERTALAGMGYVYILSNNGKIQRSSERTYSTSDKLRSNYFHGEEISFDQGLLEQDPGKNQLGQSFQYYTTSDKGQADNFFYFVAEHSSVEWLEISFKDGNNIIGTNHSDYEVENYSNTTDAIKEDKVNITLFRHSHVYNNSEPYPSGFNKDDYRNENDKKTAGTLGSIAKSAIFQTFGGRIDAWGVTYYLYTYTGSGFDPDPQVIKPDH
jgi:RHS repeat-associated protein